MINVLAAIIRSDRLARSILLIILVMEFQLNGATLELTIIVVINEFTLVN